MVSSESPYSLRFRDIPMENAAVAADTGECRVILCDSYVEDLVAVSGVGLDELCCPRWLERVAALWCGGAGRIVKTNGAVGRSG